MGSAPIFRDIAIAIAFSQWKQSIEQIHRKYNDTHWSDVAIAIANDIALWKRAFSGATSQAVFSICWHAESENPENP